MNSKFLLFFSLSVFYLSVFTACKKGDQSTTPPVETNSLYKTVQGKWIVGTQSGRVKPINTSLKIQEAKDLTSIEFLSDSTYIIVSGDEVFTGTFTATDTTSINLTGFGALSEIKIAGEKMNFKLSYQGNYIAISANKAATITLTETTKLLCKRWLIAKEEYGDTLYENSYNADKLIVLFSSSGTYLVQSLLKDSLLSADISNWQWHPTQANTFLYWWDDNEDDKMPVVIDELTNSILKLTETYTENSEIFTHKYVLTPIGASGRIAQSSGKISNRTFKKTLQKQSIFGAPN